MRYLAESNCSTRFCRPLPNRSAKVPFPNCDAKIIHFYFLCKFLSKIYRKLLSTDSQSGKNEVIEHTDNDNITNHFSK